MGIGGFAKRAARRARKAARDAKRKAEKAAKRAAEQAKRAAEESRKAAEAARREAERAAEAAKKASEKAAKEAAEAAQKAAEEAASAAEKAAAETRKAAERAAEETRRAAERAAMEAAKAAKEVEEAAKRAEEALKEAADAVLDFAEDDVVDAANKAVTWTGDAAGDVGEWAKTASAKTQRAIYKAGQFVDNTAKDAGRGVMDAADTVDDVLGDIDERLPDDLVITIGPFDISTEGVSVKPKFEIGAEGYGFNLSIGIEDIRDGLDFGITVEQEIFEFSGEGNDLQELLQSFELQAVGSVDFPKEVRGISIAYLSEPVLPRMILEAAGLNLEGFGYIKLSCKVIVGFGARAQVGLGALFPDTQGYRMHGVGGEVVLKVKLDFELFIGYKEDFSGFRLVLAVPGGVVFEVEWLDADEEGKSALGGLNITGLVKLADQLKEFVQGVPFLPLDAKLLL
eukprot:jgi/Ulvmu1/3266/UM151_0014.1